MKDGRRRFLGGCFGALALGALLLFSKPTWADGSPKMTILSIGASIETPATGVEPKISAYSGTLTKPPFSAYNSFKYVDTQATQLSVGQASKVTLANGADATLTLVSLTDGKYEVKVAVGSSSVVTIKASSGQTVFVGGPSYKSGVLVLALTPG